MKIVVLHELAWFGDAEWIAACLDFNVVGLGNTAQEALDCAVDMLTTYAIIAEETDSGIPLPNHPRFKTWFAAANPWQTILHDEWLPNIEVRKMEFNERVKLDLSGPLY